MPDPLKKTLSATQIPALFDASPYLTKWLLWQHFANDLPIDKEADERMDWGKRLEPAIFKAVCEELNLDGEHHAGQEYFRHESLPIGCTPDGTIFDLNRGEGSVECKNVDWLRWRDAWSDTEAPRHIEIQTQSQMLVRGHRWGIISCLVGGNDLRLYHREPDLALHREIEERVAEFFASVKERREPDPLGVEMEMSAFRSLRDLGSRERLSLMQSKEAHDLISEYAFWTIRESSAKKERAARKRRLEIMARDAAEIRAHGWLLKLNRSQITESAIELPKELPHFLENGNEAERKSAIDLVRNWRHITRRAGVMVKLEAIEMMGDGEPPFEDDIFSITEGRRC